jgi:hypothetical protein
LEPTLELTWELELNFKFLFIFLSVGLVACGVKGDPEPPRKPPRPSILKNYPDIQIDKADPKGNLPF